MIKAAVQKVISSLPKGESLNYLFQKYVTHGVKLDRSGFEYKLTQCRAHIENYLKLNSKLSTPWVALEVGTGWHPVVPIGLYLCGASRVWTIDKASLLRPKSVRDTLNLFVAYAENRDLMKILPWAAAERILNIKQVMKNFRGNHVSDILQGLNIYPLVLDARSTGLESASVNLFVSNNTLEHIPEHIIFDIFLEFKRVASPGATMSHFIDMRDHYSYFDASITPFNYFKYSDQSWGWFNNSLHYQNRLRISDYRLIHEGAGFAIKLERHDRGAIEDLRRMDVAERFKRYSEDELLIIGSWIVSSCVNAHVNRLS